MQRWLDYHTQDQALRVTLPGLTCGSQPSSTTTAGNSSDTQMTTLHPWPTESEALGRRPSSVYLSQPHVLLVHTTVCKPLHCAVGLDCHISPWEVQFPWLKVKIKTTWWERKCAGKIRGKNDSFLQWNEPTENVTKSRQIIHWRSWVICLPCGLVCAPRMLTAYSLQVI